MNVLRAQKRVQRNKWPLFFGIVYLFIAWSCGRHSPVLDILAKHQSFPPQTLSSWGLLQGKMSQHNLHPDALPYRVAMPLFSDYAEKIRAVWMPSEQAATVNISGELVFPLGTILLKTFAYPQKNGTRRLIETRLLIHQQRGWTALPYVWNSEQNEATLALVGGTTKVEWNDSSGESHAFPYIIPNANECKNCHETNKQIHPIGLKVSQLSTAYRNTHGSFTKSKIVQWIDQGIVKDLDPSQKYPSMPDWNDPLSGSLEERARGYLDANCAHCHRKNGPANNSALFLDYANQDPTHLGICKPPVAAGKGSGSLHYGIVPGEPDKSILLFRMLSDESEIRMPELGRVLAHKEGIALIREWITRMKGRCGEDKK